MRSIILGLLCSLLFSAPMIATPVQPIVHEKEIRRVFKLLHKHKVLDAGTFVVSVDEEGGIWGEGNELYQVYYVDLNNDDHDEYVVTRSSGSGRFFDIEGVYVKKGEKYQNLVDDIHIPMRKLIRDHDDPHATYDLQEGYPGYMHGYITIEKNDGKVSFTITRHGELDNRTYKRSHYTFIWDAKGLRLIKVLEGKVEDEE